VHFQNDFQGLIHLCSCAASNTAAFLCWYAFVSMDSADLTTPEETECRVADRRVVYQSLKDVNLFPVSSTLSLRSCCELPHAFGRTPFVKHLIHMKVVGYALLDTETLVSHMSERCSLIFCSASSRFSQ